jgi:hypothetical protein
MGSGDPGGACDCAARRGFVSIDEILGQIERGYEPDALDLSDTMEAGEDVVSALTSRAAELRLSASRAHSPLVARYRANCADDCERIANDLCGR